MEALEVTEIPNFNYGAVSLSDNEHSYLIEYVNESGDPWCWECQDFHPEEEFEEETW